MILPSLRKLQIILWSTHPKTDATAAVRRRRPMLKSVCDAALTGLLATSLIGTSVAQENPPASGTPTGWRAAAPHNMKRQASTQPVIATQPVTPVALPTRPMPFVQHAGHVRSTNVASTIPSTVPGNEYGLPIPTQSMPGQQGVVNRSSAGPNEGYSTRMRSVLSGDMMSDSMDSVGDWWEERTSQMFDRRVGRDTTVAGQPGNTAASVARSIMLPEEEVPEVDYYEVHPVAVSAPSPQESQDVAEPLLTENGINRLKTDIRTIDPTLNYALKDIDPTQLPADFNRQMDNGEYVPRAASPTVFQWAPTNLYHYPLYFEDPSLERYGHTYHPLVQPFASTGRFATQLVGLPYQMTLHPIHSHDYTLGYYRPGECAPKKHYQIPFNEEATIMQVATVVGLIVLLP
jgi:hypothetical protein